MMSAVLERERMVKSVREVILGYSPFERAAFMHVFVADRISREVEQWFGLPERKGGEPIFSQINPTLAYMHNRSGVEIEPERWDRLKSYFMNKIAYRTSIASYQLSGIWFDGPADLLDAKKKKEIEKHSLLLNGNPENDILIAQTSRIGQAAYIKRYFKTELEEYESYGFDKKDFRLANSFSKAVRAIMLFASYVTDDLRSNKNILEEDLSFWAQKQMLMHFLKFADQGMQKEDIVALFELTFDLTGMRAFLEEFPNQRMHTFYAGLYGELYGYLSLKEKGLAIRLANQEEEELGIDLIVSNSNSEDILVQVKATQFSNRSEIFIFGAEHHDREEERFKSFIAELPKNTRNRLKKAYKALYEAGGENKKSIGLIVVGIRPRVIFPENEG